MAKSNNSSTARTVTNPVSLADISTPPPPPPPSDYLPSVTKRIRNDVKVSLASSSLSSAPSRTGSSTTITIASVSKEEQLARQLALESTLWIKELNGTNSLPLLRALYQGYLESTAVFVDGSSTGSPGLLRSGKPLVSYIQQLSKHNQLRLIIQEVEKAWDCQSTSYSSKTTTGTKNVSLSRPTTDVNSNIFITVLNALLTVPVTNPNSPQYKDSLTPSQRSDSALWLLLWYINHCNHSPLNRSKNTNVHSSSTSSSTVTNDSLSTLLTSAQKENIFGLPSQSIINTILTVFNHFGPPRDSLIDRLGIRYESVHNDDKMNKFVNFLWSTNKDLTKTIQLAKEERSLPAVQRLLLAGRIYTPLSERAYLWQIRNGLWIRERGKLPENTGTQSITALQLWNSGSDDVAITVDTESLIKRTVSNFSSAVDTAKEQLHKQSTSTTGGTVTKALLSPNENGNYTIDLRPIDYHPLVDLPEDSSSLLRLVTGLLREATGTYIYVNGIGSVPSYKLPPFSSPNAGTLKEMFSLANSIGDIRHCLLIAQYYNIELTGPALAVGVQQSVKLGSIETARSILRSAEDQLRHRTQRRQLLQQKKQTAKKTNNKTIKKASDTFATLSTHFEACKISIGDAYAALVRELVNTKQYTLAVETFALMEKNGYPAISVATSNIFRAYKVLGLSNEIMLAWKQGLTTLLASSMKNHQQQSAIGSLFTASSPSSLSKGTILSNTKNNLRDISQFIVNSIESQKNQSIAKFPSLLPVSEGKLPSLNGSSEAISTDAYIHGIRSMVIPILKNRTTTATKNEDAKDLATEQSLGDLCVGLIQEFLSHLPSLVPNGNNPTNGSSAAASSGTGTTPSLPSSPLRRHVMAAYIQSFCEIGELETALQVINCSLVCGLRFHEKDLLPVIYNVTKQEEIPLAFAILQVMIRSNVYPTPETSQALMSMVTVVARQNIPLSDEVVKALNVQISNDRNIMKLMSSTSSSTTISTVTDASLAGTGTNAMNTEITDNTLIIPELIKKDKFRLQEENNNYDSSRIDIQRLSILADTELAHSAAQILGGNVNTNTAVSSQPPHPLAEAVLTARILTTAIIRWLTQQMELIIQQQQNTLKLINSSRAVLGNTNEGLEPSSGSTNGIPDSLESDTVVGNNVLSIPTEDEDDETSPLVIAQEMIRLILSEWPVSSQLANVREQLDILQVPRLSLLAKLENPSFLKLSSDGSNKDTSNDAHDNWLGYPSSVSSSSSKSTKFNRPAASVRYVPTALEKSLDIIDDSLGQYLSRYTWETTHQPSSNNQQQANISDTSSDGKDELSTKKLTSTPSLATVVTTSSSNIEELTTALRQAAIRARDRVNRRITLFPSTTSTAALAKWDTLIQKLDTSITIMKQHKLALPPKVTKSLAKTVAEIALSGAPLPRPTVTKRISNKVEGNTKHVTSSAAPFLLYPKKEGNKQQQQLDSVQNSQHHR